MLYRFCGGMHDATRKLIACFHFHHDVNQLLRALLVLAVMPSGAGVSSGRTYVMGEILLVLLSTVWCNGKQRCGNAEVW